ncbi:hypothetical protein SAMN05216188_11360 [Lentzea xinjiangensis]|uniref:Secreted protein n=1 Tax=Lentzea xinjiangensis TaxID=402600 RepID=A0A1H9QIR0_9PSEU|nr:hypothetical protein [Lentzea xinjiangensis]SER60307.1 hypothetical protein SAMN05216188_11360 [Lentzea xinjiangensis]
MRRSIGYLAAWAVVTAVAIGLSWLGIRSAMAPAPVAAVDATAGPGVLPMPTVTSISVPVPDAGPSLSLPPAPPVTPTSTRPPVVSSSVPAPPSSTDARPTPAQLPQGEWQSDGSYVHAFHLRGGDVVVRYRPTGVEALSATPGDGWSVAVEQPGGPLVVNFRTAAGRLSRLEATWTNGPTARVIEQ